MTIDRLSGIEPVKSIQPTYKVQKPAQVGRDDAVSVSSEARLLSDANKALEVIKKAPDIREDKIAEVSKKLQDPAYIDDALLSAVADKILDEYGF